VEERRENGPYTSLADFARRSNPRTVNKKVYENLAYAGAFDEFCSNRTRFFYKPEGAMMNGIEKLIKYNNDYQNSQNTSQASLFGGTAEAELPEPHLPDCEEWGLLEKLRYEKEMIGIYLTGHPLDNYRLELAQYCNTTLADLKVLEKAREKMEMTEEEHATFNRMRRGDIRIGGMVSSVQHKTTKAGKPFGAFVLEDYQETYEFVLWSDDYIKYKNFLTEGFFLQIRGVVEEKFRQEGNWDIRIASIDTLTGLRDKLIKNLIVQVPLTEVSEELMVELDDILKQNNSANADRNCRLRFRIVDPEERTVIEMQSKSVKINPSNDLLLRFEKMNLRYKLN